MMQNERNELRIEIPIVYPRSVSLFCKRREFKDPFHYWNLTKKIYKFVANEISRYDLTRYDIPSKSSFAELVMNAFDAYAATGLKTFGDKLIIKVVVQKKEGNIFVKFKDNGTGFVVQPKSILFAKSCVKKQNKPYGYFGAMGVGLSTFAAEVPGSMQLKNRKDTGAAIYIKF